jgi:hypothetical protein
MDAQTLIDMLMKIEDKTQTVEVAVKQYNKVNPVAHCEIFKPIWDVLQNNGHTHRIEIHLPDNDETFMITSKRKKQ